MTRRRFRVLCVRTVVVAFVTAVIASIGVATAKPSACPRGLERAGGGDVCIADVDKASPVVAPTRSLRNQLSLQAVMFGVWKGGKPLTVGALGTAYPRVP